MKKKIFYILAVLVVLVVLFSGQVFAGDYCCDSDSFNQVATGFSEASVNKHFDNGTDKIGVNGNGYSRADYDTKSASEADGSASANSKFSFEIFSDENSASISAKTVSDSGAETSPIRGSSVVGQENFAKQSNGATVIRDSSNGFSGGNMTMAETSGEKKEICGSGISITGNAKAEGYTNGEMLAGDGFNKTNIETGGNSSVLGPNGHVNGDGNYGANAGIIKNGASAYGEVSGAWKYSGVQAGSGTGVGNIETTITETANSTSAHSWSHSYSSASGE